MRGVAWTVVMVAFVVGTVFFAPACSKMPSSLKDAKNMSLGKFAQTINLDKDELSKSFKTNWGNAKFDANDIKKITALKQKGYKDFELKTDKGKTVQCIVTYLGSGKYQVALAGM
jgi:hypothetical protein